MIRSYTRVSETRSEKVVQANVNPPLALLTQEQMVQVFEQAITEWSDKPGWSLERVSIGIRRNEVILHLGAQR